MSVKLVNVRNVCEREVASSDYLHTYILTYLLNPWSNVLQNLTGSQLVMKFPTLYRTRRFITTFTSARHLSLSGARSIQSMPSHPTSWRSILILSSHLRLGLPSGLFLSGVPTKTLYTPLLSPLHATCPAHHIFLDLTTRTILGEVYRSFCSSLRTRSFLHFSVTSSLLGPNILLDTYYQTPSACVGVQWTALKGRKRYSNRRSSANGSCSWRDMRVGLHQSCSTLGFTCSWRKHRKCFPESEWHTA